MADRCFKCGAPEGFGCTLQEEAVPFLWRRKYCPACLRKLHISINIGTWLVLIILLSLFAWAHVRAGEKFLDSTAGVVLVFFLLQWITVVPHELGHALSARALGFENIRILIGSGLPLLSFDALGFRWLINRMPFGGFTLTTFTGAGRWRLFAMVLAGPLTSAFVVAAVCLSNRGVPPIHSFSGALLLANTAVLAINLIPFTFASYIGPTPNDGLILLGLLFGPSKFKHKKQSWISRRIWISAVRIFGVLAMLGATAICGLLAYVCLFAIRDFSATSRIMVGALFCVLCLLSAFMCWRIARDPFAPKTPAEPEYESFLRGVAEIATTSRAANDPELVKILARAFSDPAAAGADAPIEQALARFPTDPWLKLVKLQVAFAAKRFDQAIREIDEFPQISPLTNLVMSTFKIRALVESGRYDQAEAVAEHWIALDTPIEHKIHICDCMAFFPLFGERLNNLPRLKWWAERGLAFSPAHPAMKATWAAINVEAGNFAEAEAILVQRIETAPKLPNKAFALIYLGILRAKQGRTAEARKLLHQATIMTDEHWLIARAHKELVTLG
jgi:tetratricopeptide (TPR) repeat protein